MFLIFSNKEKIGLMSGIIWILKNNNNQQVEKFLFGLLGAQGIIIMTYCSCSIGDNNCS